MDAVDIVYRFYGRYRGEKRTIGSSACGMPIAALFVGEGEPRILLQYAIHAREWVTSLLALDHIARGVPFGTAAFVPLANPDGAALALRGERFLQTLPECRADFLRRINGGPDFSLWKANANAVDLNVNFDAEWGKGVCNVRAPAAENYIGAQPFSEPETRALRDFTRAFRPAATVISGSAGGYKDWCIRALGIPAFTIEAGSDALSHPLGEDRLPQLIAECGGVPALVSEMVWKINSDS